MKTFKGTGCQWGPTHGPANTGKCWDGIYECTCENCPSQAKNGECTTPTPTPTPPTPTPPSPAPQRCVTTPGFDYSGVGRTLANVGDPGACCDVCSLTIGCNAWSVRKADSFSCTLYNQTHAVPASSKTVASGTITGAPTHYQDPFTHACLPDELNLTVANIKGHWCAAACSNSTPCPLDTPAGVTATPSCEIHDPIGSGKHCALKCMSSADCGPTSPPLEVDTLPCENCATCLTCCRNNPAVAPLPTSMNYKNCLIPPYPKPPAVAVCTALPVAPLLAPFCQAPAPAPAPAPPAPAPVPAFTCDTTFTPGVCTYLA